MPRKPVTNFGKVDVFTGYTSAATSVALTSGHGARLPVTFPFPLVWWNSTDFADPADDPLVEIVSCTARATDTLTVVRAQEGTAATSKNTASKLYRMVLAWTKAMHDDLLTGEPGTIALFQQTAAPIGWTKNTTHNDKTLRVVSATAGSGGTVPFSTFAASTPGATTVSIAQMPAHTHFTQGTGTGTGNAEASPKLVPNSVSTSSTGGGGSHTHTLDLNMQYVDIILATKD